MNLIFILICAFSCNLNKNDSSNIEITNDSFKNILIQFVNDNSKFENEKVKITSVSIWVNQNDTTIGLYANKKLKSEYYIGCIKNKNEEIYFYSNSKNSFIGLYNITAEPKLKVDNASDYRETYSVFYNYKMGILEQQKPE